MDIKGIIGTVAPWLGTALGGPLGGLAVSTISKLFGLSSSTEKAISQAISGATPEQMLALKKADQEFALRMQELGFTNIKELEQIAANDRDSARRREMVVQDRIPAILATVVTVGFFGLLGFMLTHEVPIVNKDILNVMLGSLGTAWLSIIFYYFGTSTSSAKKDQVLASIAKEGQE